MTDTAQTPPLPDWLLYILNQETILSTAFWILAIIILLVLTKKIWPSISRFVTIIDATAGLPEFIARTDADMVIVKKHVANSHETNLRDDVTEAIDLSKEALKAIEKLDDRIDQIEKSELQVVVKQTPISSVRYDDATLFGDFPDPDKN